MVSLIEILRQAGKELYKHQLDFVSDALWLPRPRLLLADDVGLGKTIQSLLLIKAFMELGRVNHVLVIVPRAVLGQWAGELQRFDIQHYVVENPEFPLGYRVYLITMDRAKMPDYLNSLNRISWDLVVIDEAHKIRLDTQRMSLSHLCRTAGGCLLLTATPHTGDEQDYRFLTSLVDGLVIRREKKDVEEYEGRRIFPRLNYWVVQVRASREESQALLSVLYKLRNASVEPIVRVVVEKRAMSSPASFFKTLGRVVGGPCDLSTLEEGELDACIGNVAGWKELAELAQRFAKAPDRKLDALRKLLGMWRGRKVLVFTEYATTAEYLFQSLAGGCKVVDSGEGFAKADCGNLGVMYATAKAREKIDVDVEASLLASSFDTAVFISTDIMSEGVNLQMYDVVVNYEVVWSPTKHVQRVGRIWRFGQKADSVLVVDMVLSAGGERDEYAMYLDLLEKLYNISLRALPPQSYGEFEIYELSEDQLQKIIEIGSSAYIEEADVLAALSDGERVRELRRRIEAILKAKEEVRWKSKALVESGLKAKLGYPYETRPEPGGGYYLAEVEYFSAKQRVYTESVLVRLETPLSRSREIKKGVFREGAVDWDLVEVESGDVREDEREEVARLVHMNVWMDLKKYLDNTRDLLHLDDVEYRLARIRRARVEGVGTVAVEEFEERVEAEVRRSKNIERTEKAAVNCVREWLRNNGYVVRHDYYSGPRPFDMVVLKDGTMYVVEIKGKWIGKREEPFSFTANEIDFASRYPDRYIICTAYVEGDRCVELSCTPFVQFQKEWVLETVRGIEYKYNARKRPSS
ncbi:helicase domain protein [Thermoproteus uzoniensis 768-20]|uniref:Helicase domain protein n=1 Tax=Thermoproteus uzoniensis (strain 768-20) TaxID=999630 RepID=F2L356_THEU7|nr:SNF2-related protein [Thermoproteus uzoniensis]AEA13175.1 helicase domain protein [Thermoproteus uzoniensis 768-20]